MNFDPKFKTNIYGGLSVLNNNVSIYKYFIYLFIYLFIHYVSGCVCICIIVTLGSKLTNVQMFSIISETYRS